MPNFVSPGVYTIEKDISDYAPSLNTSIVGVVGFAKKGPTNKPVLITSQASLVDTFGEPSEDIPGQGLEGAFEILEQTNTMYFVRAADENTATESTARLSLGSCPAVIFAPDAGADTAITENGALVKVSVTDNAGVSLFPEITRTFTIPAGVANDARTALQIAFGEALDNAKVTVYPKPNSVLTYIVGAHAGANATMTVEVTDLAGAAIPGLQLTPIVADSGAVGAAANPVTAQGATYNANTAASYFVESLFPGTGYQGGFKPNGDASGNTITIEPLGGPNVSLTVNQDGAAYETFKVSLLSTNFIEDVIGKSPESPTSTVIKGSLQFNSTDLDSTTKIDDWSANLENVIGGETNVKFWKPLFAAGTPLTGGNDGFGTDVASRNTALIGSASQEPKTGMQALDDNILNIGIALIPGIYSQSVQNELVTLAEKTQNFLALVAPPYGIGTVQNAIDWTNGQSDTVANSRTAAINSSFAAIYFPHLKVFSTFDSKDRWYDPTIFAARQMCYTDGVADSWFAPAGFRRGRLTKPLEVEVKLNQGDRDTMYSGGNVVNPIVGFPQQGITIFGQRTAQRSPSALDRINVRRLLIYIRKVIQIAAQRFVFEPNDQFTWAQIEGVLNPFLDDIRKRRGLVEFRVVCDETTNTPLRVDRNELWTKVLIKPTKTAEILVFEINITGQGANLGSL